MSLTVSLTDEQKAGRDGLKLWMETQAGLQMVGEATDRNLAALRRSGTAMRRSLRRRQARAWQSNSSLLKVKDSPGNCRGFSLELSRFLTDRRGISP